MKKSVFAVVMAVVAIVSLLTFSFLLFFANPFQSSFFLIVLFFVALFFVLVSGASLVETLVKWKADRVIPRSIFFRSVLIGAGLVLLLVVISRW
jgi:hypothetical protein